MFFRDHKYSIFGAAIWVGLVIIFLLFCCFRTPLPLPPEEGILLEFDEPIGGGSMNVGNNNNDNSNDNNFVPESGYNTDNSEDVPAMKNSTTPNSSDIEKPANTTPAPTNKAQDKVGNNFGNFGSGTGSGTSGSGTNDGNPGSGTSGSGGGSGNAPSGSGGGLGGRTILYVPDMPSKDNLFGTVTFKITVDNKGNVTYVSVYTSSGIKEVDNLALEYVKKIKYEAITGTQDQTGFYTVTLKQR
jgi:TonB family protein